MASVPCALPLAHPLASVNTCGRIRLCARALYSSLDDRLDDAETCTLGEVGLENDEEPPPGVRRHADDLGDLVAIAEAVDPRAYAGRKKKLGSRSGSTRP